MGDAVGDKLDRIVELLQSIEEILKPLQATEDKLDTEQSTL
jgi:hypothetical protein